MDVGEDSFGDGAEVVVGLFLTFGGLGTEESTASHVQIGSGVVVASVDNKEFLLRAKCGSDLLHVCVTEQVQDFDRGLAECMNTAKN